MSGRHRDVGRTFASGSAKRNAKEDKEKSKDKLLRIITLTLYLKGDIPPPFIRSRIDKYFNVKVTSRLSSDGCTNLSLTGTKYDIIQSKNFINIYTNPQEIMWKQIHEDLVLVFQSASFIAKLERQYPVVLSLNEEKRMVILHGSSLVTNIISCLIDQLKTDIYAETSLSSELIVHIAQEFIFLCKKHKLELVEMQSISSSAKFAIVKMLNQEEEKVTMNKQTVQTSPGPSKSPKLISSVEDESCSAMSDVIDKMNTSDLIITNVVEPMDTSDVIITDVVYNAVHKKPNIVPSSPDVIITAVEHLSNKKTNDEVFRERPKRGIPCVRSSNSVSDSKREAYSFSPANINNVNMIASMNTIRKHLSAFVNNSNKLSTSDRLRHIIIDGSNVAYHHGRNANFSVYGIILCMKYFFQRGHRKLTVLIPHFRRCEDMEVLDTLQNWGLLNYTPSRFVNNVRQVCYDDRMLVQLACEVDGVLVSNDQYRDIMKESQKFKNIIEKRLLMYLFVDDTFMVPEDPHGLGGPSLSQLLSK